MKHLIRKPLVLTGVTLALMLLSVGFAPRAIVAQEMPDIPEAAWAWSMGQPFENPPVPKVDYNMIDDGPRNSAKR